MSNAAAALFPSEAYSDPDSVLSSLRCCVLVLRTAELREGGGLGGVQHFLCLSANSNLSAAAGPPHTTGGTVADQVNLSFSRGVFSPKTADVFCLDLSGS